MPSSAARFRLRPRPRRTSSAGALFVLPFFAGFTLVFLAPFGYAIRESLYGRIKSSTGLGGETFRFVGLDNFVNGLTDAYFWQAVGRVSAFAVVQIPIMLTISLTMALLLDAVQGRKAQVFRLGLLIPYMIPLMVGTLVWLYLYSPRLGPLTDAGHAVGLDINFFSAKLLWFSIGNLLTWGHAGFNMLVLYSALRAVPRELFESARIDGASELRIAWSVKIPQVRGTLVLTGMLSVIGMLQIFSEPLVFRVTSPETVSSRFTPIMMVFSEAFSAGNYQYAAALSVILALIVGLASAAFYRLVNRASA